MSWLNPVPTMINGKGKPRLMVLKVLPFYSSTGTTAYSGLTITETGTPDFSHVLANMRVYVPNGVATGFPCWAKITNVDNTGKILTVDAWTPSLPVATSAFVIDGWVIDLPYCNLLTETFGPDQLVHELYRSRKESRFYGWFYSCVLDYSQYVPGSVLYDMAPALGMAFDDRLVLIPRRDAPEFQYNVFYDGDVSMARYGLAEGHKGVVFKFTAKETIASWPIQSGYGFGYAQNYGNQL